MDSITQATLGAAVGHLCWQKELSHKALFAGALLGTIPDLDIIIYPFLDGVQRLYWHRGESHSIWFMVLGSLAFGLLLTRLKVGWKLSVSKAGIGVFFIFGTHILIDVFTTYGTQLLAPISRKGFALANFYIIDPLFTILLLTGTIGAYIAKKRPVAKRVNLTCLALASMYAIWSLSAQSIASRKFQSALAEQDIEITRQITSAGPFTTFLWRHIAETPTGFQLGYWSWMDDINTPIHFQFIPRNGNIVEQIKNTRTFQTVDWFSKGWWFVVDSDNERARVADLRFSEIPSARNQPVDEWDWPFAWQFDLAADDETRLKPVVPSLKDPSTTLKLFILRIRGKGEWIKISK